MPDDLGEGGHEVGAFLRGERRGRAAFQLVALALDLGLRIREVADGVIEPVLSLA
ncbi:MAG TPA: hypothetical protein VFQ44_05670 [Streptosporangiaceae bacterium]|nr:hypothetical protein [Streptosporangiaceae bacterium]